MSVCVKEGRRIMSRDSEGRDGISNIRGRMGPMGNKAARRQMCEGS